MTEASAPETAKRIRKSRRQCARWTRRCYTQRRLHDNCPPSRVPVTPAETHSNGRAGKSPSLRL
eukprot:2004997-Alexandrium_andersonii.AAC.1